MLFGRESHSLVFLLNKLPKIVGSPQNAKSVKRITIQSNVPISEPNLYAEIVLKDRRGDRWVSTRVSKKNRCKRKKYVIVYVILFYLLFSLC